MAKFNSCAAERLLVRQFFGFFRNSCDIWELLLKGLFVVVLASIEMGDHALCNADLVLEVALGNAFEVAIHCSPSLGD